MKISIRVCSVLVFLYGNISATEPGTGWFWIPKATVGPSKIRKNDVFQKLDLAIDDGNYSKIKNIVENSKQENFDGWSEKRKAYVLLYAVENELEEIIKIFVDSNFDLDISNNRGKPLLIIATESNNTAIVEYLLEAYAKDSTFELNKYVNEKDPSTGFSALMVAAENGNKELVEALIKCKADVNTFSHLGCSPLSLAMRNNHKNIIRILKNAGADVDLANQNGDTPLSMATYYYQKATESYHEKKQWKDMLKVLKKKKTSNIKPFFNSSIGSYTRAFFRSLFGY